MKLVIGDIHGCYKELEILFNRININKYNKIIFLGDYIDRGEFSYEVLNFLINLKQTYNNKIIILKGNHESLFINAFMDLNNYDCWIYNGGDKTEKNFTKNNLKEKELLKIRNFIKQLPLYYEDKYLIYNHSGYSLPNMKNCLEENLLWDREHIYQKKLIGSKKVIFGHTPNNNFEIYKTINEDICIDTGCIFKGKLTGIEINKDKIINIIQIENLKKA